MLESLINNRIASVRLAPEAFKAVSKGSWGQYKTPGMLGFIHAQRGRARSTLFSRKIFTKSVYNVPSDPEGCAVGTFHWHLPVGTAGVPLDWRRVRFWPPFFGGRRVGSRV